MCIVSVCTGALLQKCIDILERHYELYESCVVHGTACLKSLMGVMHLVVTASSGAEVSCLSSCSYTDQTNKFQSHKGL